jgi:hypothetical protein
MSGRLSGRESIPLFETGQLRRPRVDGSGARASRRVDVVLANTGSAIDIADVLVP